MAPRRFEQWKNHYRNLLIDHNITFKGPEQPLAWPNEHQHLFRIIRQIGATTYESYLNDSEFPAPLKHQREKEVDRIVENARTLHYDTNEQTWRGLESVILDIFTTRAVCKDCSNELHTFEYQAEPSNPEKFAELGKRRRKRVVCKCNHEKSLVDSDRKDKKKPQPIIFLSRMSHTMTHWHLDDLEAFKVKIPMQPDRTIGLSPSGRMEQALRTSSSYIDHYPLAKEKGVMYPFLLLEAKREANTAGFVAVEAQTAFPLRRILLLQNQLREESSIEFDPLVWFFATQGGEWRLYAGTMKDDNIHVYDLWHGFMESKDGSLQVILIVNYIWTWARDVYRPQIRDCLFALTQALRDVTPSTLKSLSRSQSVLSESIAIPLRPSQLDTVMQDDLSRLDSLFTSNTATAWSSVSHLQSLHAFSHINDNDDLSQTCIKYTKFVRFSFCCASLSSKENLLSGVRPLHGAAASLIEHLSEENAIAILKWKHIYALEMMWTGENSSVTTEHKAKILNNQWMAVTIRFASECSRGDWQIVRRLECFVWETADIQNCDELHQAKLAKALEQAATLNHQRSMIRTVAAVRNLSNHKSIECALKNARWTLSGFHITGTGNSVRWTVSVLDEPNCSERLQKGVAFNNIQYQTFHMLESSRVVVLDESIPGITFVGDAVAVMPLTETVNQMSGLIAKKPPSWPAQCPKFCLFVLVDTVAGDQDRLGSVLREVLRKRNIFGLSDEQSHHQDLILTLGDRALLNRWERSFR